MNSSVCYWLFVVFQGWHDSNFWDVLKLNFPNSSSFKRATVRHSPEEVHFSRSHSAWLIYSVSTRADRGLWSEPSSNNTETKGRNEERDINGAARIHTEDHLMMNSEKNTFLMLELLTNIRILSNIQLTSLDFFFRENTFYPFMQFKYVDISFI